MRFVHLEIIDVRHSAGNNDVVFKVKNQAERGWDFNPNNIMSVDSYYFLATNGWTLISNRGPELNYVKRELHVWGMYGTYDDVKLTTSWHTYQEICTAIDEYNKCFGSTIKTPSAAVNKKLSPPKGGGTIKKIHTARTIPPMTVKKKPGPSRRRGGWDDKFRVV